VYIYIVKTKGTPDVCTSSSGVLKIQTTRKHKITIKNQNQITMLMSNNVQNDILKYLHSFKKILYAFIEIEKN